MRNTILWDCNDYEAVKRSMSAQTVDGIPICFECKDGRLYKKKSLPANSSNHLGFRLVSGKYMGEIPKHRI